LRRRGKNVERGAGGTVVEGKRRNGKLMGFLRGSEGMKEEIR